MEKWTKEDGTMLDQREDPLNDLRDDTADSMRKKAFLNESSERFLTEEEEEAFELRHKNDPELTRIENEEITEDQDIPSYIHSSLGSTSMDIIDDFEEDLPPAFEDRDILGEALAKVRQQKQADRLEENVEYGRMIRLEKFKLMEACSKYKAVMKLMPEVLRHKPVYADGSPITTEDIAEQATEYNTYKQKNELSKFNASELKIMQECAAWNHFYNKLPHSPQAPVSVEGKELSSEEIDANAAKYSAWREKDPESFAELKLETGKWEKKDFLWRETNYKGQKQWYCLMDRIVPFNGIKEKLTRKYITEKKPIKKEGDFYYTVKRDRQINDKYSVAVIDIKYPLQSEIGQQQKLQESTI